MSQTESTEASAPNVPPAPTPEPTPPPTVHTDNDVSPPKKSVTQRFYIIIHILLRPVIFPFSAGHFMFRETKNISIVVLNELKKVGKLGFNVVELGLLMTSALRIITFKDGDTKPLMPRMMDVFNKMAETLTDFQVLPCSKEAGALGHLMLNRLPNSIWDTLLPYPHPFFRGSITQATKSDTNALITSTEAIPDGEYKPIITERKRTEDASAEAQQ